MSFSADDFAPVASPAIGGTSPAPIVGQGSFSANDFAPIATPKVAPVAMPSPDTSKVFSGTTSLSGNIPSPKVTPTTSTLSGITTPSSDIKIKPSSDYGTGPGAKTTISVAPKESVWDKIINPIKNTLFGDDPRLGIIHDTIVSNNLLDIGKQLGIDKQIPIDTTKDPSVQKDYHDKAVTDYVRNNYDTIRKSLKNPEVLPSHPDLLSPAFSDIGNNVQGYSKEAGLGYSPQASEIIPAAINAISGAVESEQKKASDFLESFSAGHSISEKVGKGASALAGGVGVLFSPISAIFAGAEKVPLFGTLAISFDAAFAGLGYGGTAITNHLIDAVPDSVLSPQAKANIKPGIGEIGALIAQVVAGGKIAKVMGDATPKLVEKYGVDDAKTIVTKATEIAKTTAQNKGMDIIKKGADTLSEEVKASVTNHGEAATHQIMQDKLGVTPETASKVINHTMADTHENIMKTFTPAEETAKVVPTEDTLKIPPTEEKPTYTPPKVTLNDAGTHAMIEQGGKTIMVDGLKKGEDPLSKLTPEQAKDFGVQISTESGRESAIKAPVGEGEIKTSKLAERINPDEKSPSYKVAKNSDQRALAQAFVDKYPERAERIAKGLEQPPEGHLKNFIVNEVRSRAIEQGDVAKATEVLNSQSLEAVRHGQEIQALSEKNADPNSPEYWAKKAIDNRMESNIVYKEKIGGKKASTARMSDEVKKVKAEVTKSQLKIKAAQDILDKILC